MLLRSLPRAVGTSASTSLSSYRASSCLYRTFRSSFRSSAQVFQTSHEPPKSSPGQQTRSAHAISNPTLAGIEKRWEAMPPQEQAELWMMLRDRMKVDWHEMTLQEKKAGTPNSPPIYQESIFGFYLTLCSARTLCSGMISRGRRAGLFREYPQENVVQRLFRTNPLANIWSS